MCGLPGIKMNAQIFKSKVAECMGTAQGLQQVDPFFGDTQQMYRHSSSLHDNYPARVLLEAETRYASVLTWNGVRKLSILVNIRSSGWHSSRQNHDMHYTLRGYNQEGWMVVMLEMKAGNASDVFAYRAREHVESVSLGKLGLSILYISRCLDMDGIAIDNGNIASFGRSQFEPTILSSDGLSPKASSAAAFASSRIINGLCVDLHRGTYYYKFAYTNKTCFRNPVLATSPNILPGFPRPLQSHYNPLPISIGHLL
ncbi:hypothetical protein IW261DRAFT_1599464 [Armillaria novae-zelandiae]|uniref:Uncharacterized protein n=1 Tax=Armillaria novae-zelandiae TaxID=153914 RepID=A0AA39N9I0_9AGAR|nr:hypothetical protein IW261DRAFT_1599464 [Armillaria novae-zelandiae]